MSVGLINVYSTHNLGDAAILEALTGMCQGRAVNAVLPADYRPLPIAGMQPTAALASGSLRISVGGDIFNNARPQLITKRFLANLRELAQAPRRTMLFGQSMPSSCRGLSLKALAYVARRLASVTVRERASWQRLKAASVNASLSHDAAFALAPSELGRRLAREILARHELGDRPFALLSVRGFDPLYPQDAARFESEMAKLGGDLARSGLEPVLLVQAAVDQADGDWPVVQRLKAMQPAFTVLDLIGPAVDGNGVARLIGLLELADVAVAVRYHTAVLRLVAGRMPFVLAYSGKGRDLVERLALPGSDLESFDAASSLGAILATADRAFDPSPLARDVRDHFHDGLAAIDRAGAA